MNVYGQLVKAQMENLASDPSNTATGLLYYNTGSDIIKYYDAGSTSWQTIANIGKAQTFTNKTISGSSNTLTVLAGSQLSGQVPIANGGTAASTKAGGFDALSPMSASGDIIYGGASGTGTRLAKGSDGQFLSLVSGVPAWAAVTVGNLAVTTKTADYTATTSDDLILVNTNAVTVTLPAATTAGKVIRVQKIGSDTNSATVTRAGADTIVGASSTTSIVLPLQYEIVTLVADGTSKWYIVSHTHPDIALYANNSSTSITNAGAVTAVFGTVVLDTHSAYNNSTGIFTCPKAGRYYISSCVKLNSASYSGAQRLLLVASKNAGASTQMLSYQQVQVTQSSIFSLDGSCIFDCAKGDTIRVTVDQNSSGSVALSNSASENFLAIKYVSKDLL